MRSPVFWRWRRGCGFVTKGRGQGRLVQLCEIALVPAERLGQRLVFPGHRGVKERRVVCGYRHLHPPFAQLFNGMRRKARDRHQAPRSIPDRHSSTIPFSASKDIDKFRILDRPAPRALSRSTRRSSRAHHATAARAPAIHPHAQVSRSPASRAAVERPERNRFGLAGPEAHHRPIPNPRMKRPPPFRPRHGRRRSLAAVRAEMADTG